MAVKATYAMSPLWKFLIGLALAVGFAGLGLAIAGLVVSVQDKNTLNSCNNTPCTASNDCTTVACIDGTCETLSTVPGCCPDASTCPMASPPTYFMNILNVNTIQGADSSTVTIANATVNAGVITAVSTDLTSTSNQIILGTGTTTTLSATAPASSRTYSIYDAGRNTVVQLGIRQVINIQGTTSLSIFNSGSMLYLLNTTQGYTVTLPLTANSTGVWFEIEVGVVPPSGGFIFTTLGGETTLNALAVSQDATAASNLIGLGVHLITFVATNGKVADSCFLNSNGINWFARCNVQLHTGISFS